MGQPGRRLRVERPTILLSALLAGALLFFSAGLAAFPGVTPGDPGMAAGDTRTQTVGVRVRFSRLWAAYELDKNDSLGPQPIVFFSSADPADDAPFGLLLAKPATLAALNFGAAPGWKSDSRGADGRSGSETECLATAIYFEARGEDRRGRLAVAQVVMNRVKDRAYPKTICGVVYQHADDFHRCQFSFACDGVADRIADKRSWREALRLAEEVTTGTTDLNVAEVGNATTYHATYVTPHWASKMKKVETIGGHIFYARSENGSNL